MRHLDSLDPLDEQELLKRPFFKENPAALQYWRIYATANGKRAAKLFVRRRRFPWIYKVIDQFRYWLTWKLNKLGFQRSSPVLFMYEVKKEK